MNSLTEEIVEKYTKIDTKNGAHLKCLRQFSVLGFIENLEDFGKITRILDNESIEYGSSHAKYLIWLDTVSDNLKKAFAAKRPTHEKRTKS
jgi:lipid A disaccharide synthetase